MNNTYAFCIANHSKQPPMGTEAWIYQALTVNDFKNFSAIQEIISTNQKFYSDDLGMFDLCLASAACMWTSRNAREESELKDPVSGSYVFIFGQSVMLAIEGRLNSSTNKAGLGSGVITAIDRESARTAFHNVMEYEFYMTARQNQNYPYLTDANGDAILDENNNGIYPTMQLNQEIIDDCLAYRDEFFDAIWDAAIIMYNAIKVDGADDFRISGGQRKLKLIDRVLKADLLLQEVCFFLSAFGSAHF